MVFPVLSVVAGRSHPSGGPTWPLNGRSIVALGDSETEEVLGRTTSVADVGFLFGVGWKREKPRCLLEKSRRFSDAGRLSTMKPIVMRPNKERVARKKAKACGQERQVARVEL